MSFEEAERQNTARTQVGRAKVIGKSKAPKIVSVTYIQVSREQQLGCHGF
jgi:hypothetical protein